MMNYFLVKTDPETFGIKDFMASGTTLWDGVHSYAAINYIKKMNLDDIVYIYESQTTRSIVGKAIVIGEPFQNTADPRFSWAVNLKFLETIKPITLKQIKQETRFKDFALVRESRLSVMSVPKEVQAWIEKQS